MVPVIHRESVALLKVQADDLGAICILKVTRDRIFDRCLQVLCGVCFGEDGVVEGFGFIATLTRFLYHKDDFAVYS